MLGPSRVLTSAELWQQAVQRRRMERDTIGVQRPIENLLFFKLLQNFLHILCRACNTAVLVSQVQVHSACGKVRCKTCLQL